MAKRRIRQATKAEPARTSRPARTKAQHAVVTIRAQHGKEILEAQVTYQPVLERLAQEWSYILRTRSRWSDDLRLRNQFRDRALESLTNIGIPRQFITKLATVERVEVEMHDWDATNADTTRIHEAASEIPWEYLISAATRGEGRFQSMLITRLFRNGQPPVSPQPPKHVLFVESAPGRLNDEYSFGSEEARISAAVGAIGDRSDIIEIVKTPQLSELRYWVQKRPWDVIHISGVDTHQVLQFVDNFYDDFENQYDSVWKKISDTSGAVCDGMILREGRIAELPVCFDELGRALVNVKHPPSVVTLNLYHSGARTARELVKRGAYAALGFLDEIDDELAELFFQAFYWAWCWPNDASSIPDAFIHAWQKMSGHRLHGTTIMIWMGQSIFENVQTPPRSSTQATETEESRSMWLTRLDNSQMDELLQVEFAIAEEVNYSLLHNDRQLLNTLTLTKLVDKPLYDITVQVELNLGAYNYPYRYTQLVFEETQLILAPQVKIPLTATLPRSLRERLQSTVYVKVTCGQRTAYEMTKRVTLIPVDEWLDDTEKNPWLPSFVLPRDPAIQDIINSSRRYLIGITDEPASGFDGYQSVVQDEDASVSYAGVDAQVQAIWTALVNEYRLQYINPPPSYSERSQRLRTPSDILASNTGTCIDLALLLASCLEYIDIYPVIVLLTGHAFVGYWCSENAHEEFSLVQRIPAEVPKVGSTVARKTTLPYVDEYGWRLTVRNYNEIMAYVTAGDLKLLEATYLTATSSFYEAVEEGRANMRSRWEFDSLLDILLARSAHPPVTPLPIINE